MSDGETPRFELEVYDRELSDVDRHDLEQMIHHVLDGNVVFSICDYEPEPGDREALKTFIDEELRDDE